MKTFKQYISEIAKGIYKGFGMLIIDGQKVDVEVELYGTDNKNNTFLTRIVDIDKKYQKTHPIGKEVAIPAKIFRRGRWVKVKTPNAFETHIREKVTKTEYYLDTSKDNTEKYVANDGDYWYVGRVGMKGGSSFLKFVAAHGKDSYFESGKLKKVTPKEIEKDATKSPSIINTVDFKKLYKK